MRTIPRVRIARNLVVCLALVLASACVDDDEGTAPTLDASFVGYTNPQTQQTTCGNCHVDRQRTWVETAHARAFADMQNTGQAQASCEQCHTTNGYSNQAADTSGYFAVSGASKDFYKDVQCEACHGPGAGHVMAPDDAQPLTTIVADTTSGTGCGTCHTTAHAPFVDQWITSGHGRVSSSANGNANCRGCHSGQGALARFDAGANYLEENSSIWQPVTCAVCHDPHGSDNPSQLRLPVATPSIEANLCMQCHQRRSVPDPTSTSGAHSPQGPFLLGEAGYIPPNFIYDDARAASTHGTTANPNLCATCHMERYTVTDAATGAFQMNATGHNFKAIPCVDANGMPTGAATCPDAERRFNACATGGCHSTTQVASNLRQVLTGRLQGYLDVLWKDLNNSGKLDPSPTDEGLLAVVRLNSPCDFSTATTPPASGDPCFGQPAGSTIITVGEGVWFDADLVKNADGSFGVHNPIFAEALLLGGTTALRAQYPYLPPAPPAERSRLAVLERHR